MSFEQQSRKGKDVAISARIFM